MRKLLAAFGVMFLLSGCAVYPNGAIGPAPFGVPYVAPAPYYGYGYGYGYRPSYAYGYGRGYGWGRRW